MKTTQNHNLGLLFLKILVGEGKNGLWTSFFYIPTLCDLNIKMNLHCQTKLKILSLQGAGILIISQSC